MVALVDPQDVFIGDDWVVGPVKFTAGSAPVDFTGCTFSAVFYASKADNGTDMVAAGLITPNADLTTGQIDSLRVPRIVTAGVKARATTDTTYPTRVVLAVIDAANLERTRLIVRFNPLLAKTYEG